ncbi:MAG: S1 RNA-binding domain-containing protein, partial [Geminicoccales bacterium]
MPKRMLIDSSHPEETRVVVLSGNRLEEFDYEAATKKQIKGNIYLAKITRVEPSLQAAFVEYGGNRHGFLPFSEIHPDYYRIPIADREALIEEHAAEIAAEVGDRPELTEQPGESGGPVGDEAGEPDGSGESADALAAEGGPEESDREESRNAESDSEETRIALAEIPSVEATADAPGEVEEVPVETKIDTVGGEEVEEEARRRARLMRRYKIQEVIKRRQVILVQVTKEERGTKGAALTTYLSLAGRYCVLMPNTGKGGGISRKISSAADRRRLK